MRSLLIAVLFAVAAGPPQPSQQYFTNARDVRVTAAERQNYFVVDPELWAHSRTDLTDLRLYADTQEVPYALITQRASAATRELQARIFDLGTAGGATVFVVDLSGAGEYNRVTLHLDAKDFITRATVEGLEQLHGGRTVRLGDFTLYDFTREQLGSSSVLKLPDSRFPYLRITLPGIAPQQVTGATVGYRQEAKANWTELPAAIHVGESGKNTVITWDSPRNAPLDRVVFTVTAENVNFRRPVVLRDSAGQEIARGEVSRIHIQRAGKMVDSEDLALDVPDARSPGFQIVIDNGDDPPLAITQVQTLSLERRVYFDPHGKTALHLYYGDPVLSAPTYDYAKLFQESPDAARAELAPGMHNTAYTGRPDERPWTERHPAVLWTVLVIAVLALGAVALRGLRA